MARYLIILEAGARNYSAYAPDLPGVIATGKTRQETIERMQEAVAFHLEGMRQHGEAIPEPNSNPAFVEVDVPAQTANAS